MEKLTDQKRKQFIRNNITIMSITKDELRQEYNEIFDKLKEYEDKIENGELVETKKDIWQNALDLYREVKEMVLKDVRAEIVNEMVEKLLLHKVLYVDEIAWQNEINQVAKEVIK